MEILESARFCYDVLGDVIRIHGYLPKSFDDLDAQSDSSEDEYIAELQRRHADRERRRQSGADGDLAAGDAAGF